MMSSLIFLSSFSSFPSAHLQFLRERHQNWRNKFSKMDFCFFASWEDAFRGYSMRAGSPPALMTERNFICVILASMVKITGDGHHRKKNRNKLLVLLAFLYLRTTETLQFHLASKFIPNIFVA